MRIILLIIAMTISTNSFGGSSEGQVTTPLVNSFDVFMFSAGTHNGRPVCATQSLGTWAVSLNTPHGKAIQALVLSAQAQNKNVHVEGKNTCDVWGDRESVEYAFIVD